MAFENLNTSENGKGFADPRHLPNDRSFNALLDEISDVSRLLREKNGVYLNDDYHIDARPLKEGGFKVDVQFTAELVKKKKIGGREPTTVAVCIIEGAPSAADVIAALKASREARSTYRVFPG